tara:strand:+ start:637 stop:951 length:315 start_codon:yes stop_codon:yes gene_type:complete
MIDTDKYEGHTEGKWILGEYKGRPSISAVEDVETPTRVRSIARGLNPSQTADHALIADAPLLLQEVKRLRKALLLIANTANGKPFVSGHIGLPLVHEVFKELIE